MSLKTKLSLMLSAFLLVIAVLAAGTMLIFEKMSFTTSSLGPISELNKHYSDLDRGVGELVEATRSWAGTGDA
ncbi:MAG: hypothetical protein M0Z60_10265, partial [Nitrospiraceae bacterium]|nr:hypothetical protein [Nitrospiraceae bacterium]